MERQIRILTVLAKLLPSVSAIQHRLGDIYRQLGEASGNPGDWEQAATAYKTLIKLNPDNGSGHYGLAEYCIYQQRWKDAVYHAETALNQAPDSPWFHYAHGKALMGQGNFDLAIEAFQAAIAQNDAVQWFYLSLGETLLKQGRTSEAIAPLRRCKELDPSFAWTRYHLGRAYLAEERLEEAVAELEIARTELPEQVELFGDQLNYSLYLHRQEQRIADYCQSCNQIRTTQGGQERPLDVLLVTPFPTYPPNRGGAARMFQAARGLGKRHRLVVASLLFSPKEYQSAMAMEQYCELAVVAVPGDVHPEALHQPQPIRKYSSQRLTRILQQLSAIPFDIVCFEFIYAAQYHHLFPNAYTVMGEHNIESALLQSFTALQPNQETVNRLAREASAMDAFKDAEREASKLAAYEDQHWPQFNLRTVVSRDDQAKLLSRCPDGETWIVNNGIDTEATPLLPNEQARKLFFFGTLDYFPNIDGAVYLAEEVMPLIWQTEPEMQLCIAGANPPEVILSLAQDPRIEIVADPEVMEDVAQDCHISVVPLRVGSGTRIKILHSMAMGLPVVSTSLGCEGLEGIDGEHLLIRDQPEALAEAVLALDGDRDQWELLRRNGRSLVEARYDWQAIYADFETKLFEAWQQFHSPVS